jgi:GTPase
MLRLEATMNVERDSQKPILIRRKGEMLKKISTQARKELEELHDKKIYLGLFVKVVPGWHENPHAVRELDWHAQPEAMANNDEPSEESQPRDV